MALVCALLGPAMASLAVLAWGSVQLIEYLKAESEVPVSLDPLQALVLEFSDRAAIFLLGLGMIFAIAGIVALWGGPKAPRALLAGAWGGIAAMVVLAVVWSQAVVQIGLGWPFHVVGVVTHAFQAYLLYRAAQIVRRGPPVEG